ncbi:MAG: fasciclin domain-containing protein [Pseudomonadota bacterium]
MSTTTTSTDPIATIAANDGRFDILVAALGAAELAATFAEPGDFTVFAPTDDAFRALASDTLGLDIDGLDDAGVATALVDAVGVDLLTTVLLFHVRAGAQTVAELQAEGSVDTLVGSSFTVDGNQLIDADPEVEDPEFVEGATDIHASNGIIQAIDRVLLPIDLAEANAQPTIADIAGGNDAFEALVAALTATGLLPLFTDPSNDFTVFAPTDDAFRQLAEDLGLDTTGVSDADLAGLLVDALGESFVTDVLLYHVKPGGSELAELQAARVVETALTDGLIAIDGTTLVDADPDAENPQFIAGLTDIEASNGEIQAIDRVLLPVDLDPVSSSVEVGSFFGDDVQRGGAASDAFFGFSGDDVQLGGAGDDVILGNRGDDLIFGEAGDDLLRGGRGDDTIVDGAGDDVVRGGRGNDTLIAGAGDDVFRGGFGDDTFDFSTLEGHNVVRDFRDGDTLILSAETFESAAAVIADGDTIGRGLLIEGEEGSVFVNRAFALDESDILLV